MRHDEIMDLLAAYTLDAVEPNETLEVEAHIDLCAECRDEVDKHRATAAYLVGTIDDAPPEIWERLLRQTAPQTVAALRPNRSRLGSRIGIAASLLIVAGIALQTARLDQAQVELAIAQQRNEQLETTLIAGDLERAASLASTNPESVTAVLEGGLGEGTIIILPNGIGFLIGDTLPALDHQHTYQLWAVQGGQVISAGILGSDPGVTTFTVDPSILEGLVITAERSGGVAKSQQTEASAWFVET